MKIYTKTGDLGETGIFNNKRVAKSEKIIEANGALDEATSFIGFAREQIEDDKMRQLFTDIQHDLYEVMGYIAGAKIDPKNMLSDVQEFEKIIDAETAKLPKLTRFILPQGGEAAVRVHVARAVVRRAERAVVSFVKEKNKYSHDKKIEEIELAIIKYLNRLSDLLFTIARKFAQVEKTT